MDLSQAQLQEKALLLLRRERELFELRMKNEQVTHWLGLTQALPRFFDDPQTSISDAYAGLRKALIVALRWQRVSFLELHEQTLTPIAPAGSPRSLTAESLALVSGEAAGFENDPTEGAGAALAEALQLARFIWSRIDVPGRLPVLVAAGFDRAKAKFQGNFDASDAAHLRNATQHIQGLVGNVLLVHALERERDRLQQTNETLELRDRELRALTEELRAANDTLEQRVEDRTEELGRRNGDMRLVLDNVVQGLVTLDAQGRLAQERSAKIDEWFGSYAGNPYFFEYIMGADPKFADRFWCGHDALIEGFLPIELCLQQLPTRFHAGVRAFHCSYRPLTEASGGCGLLIMIDDVTEQVRLTQEEAEQSELLAVFQGLTRDRDGFLIFFGEANHLVEALTGGALDETTRRRHLHTLKGNAAMQGARVIADVCHRAEDLLAMESTGDITATIQRLGERWAAIKQTVAVVVGERTESVVEIPTQALERLCQDIDDGAPVDQIARQLSLLWLEPVERPLGRLAQHARLLAQRLGRAELSVLVEAGGTRVDPRRFGGLWAALVHVLRNAVDHGIELPAERLARGKSAEGRIWLRASHTAQQLMIEIEDDGRGIDWARVREIAESRGLPRESANDLVLALLSDGFSTRSSATEMSGRGIGMSAVHEQVLELGGTLTLSSQVGTGSCWAIVVPLAAAARGSQAITPDELIAACS